MGSSITTSEEPDIVIPAVERDSSPRVEIEEPVVVLASKKPSVSIIEELRFANDIIDFRINKSIFKEGEAVTITYTYFDFSTSGKWFGIFPKSAGLGEWNVWKYVDTFYEPQQSVMQLVIPSEGQVGAWEVRFYADGGNENVTGILPFIVEGEAFDPISITLPSNEVKQGGYFNVAFSIDRRINVEGTRLVYYTKSTPSIYAAASYYELKYYIHTGVVPVYIQYMHAQGPHEIRCFTNSSSYTPCIRVPFQVNVNDPAKLDCYPRNIKDGSVLLVEWVLPTSWSILDDSQITNAFYLCVYPEDDLVEENGFQYAINNHTGSAKIRIESGQKSTGKWQVRLVKRNMWVMSVSPFSLIGAKEAFASKMLENITFTDIIVNIQH